MNASQDAGPDQTGLELSADFHAQVEAQTMALTGGNDKIWQVAHAALFHVMQLRYQGPPHIDICIPYILSTYICIDIIYIIDLYIYTYMYVCMYVCISMYEYIQHICKYIQ
jgi:hypothetical protein